MTLTDRVAAFAAAYPRTPASWPWATRERDRAVLYGVWVIGNDYRNAARFYGSFPPGFLARVMALYPDAGADVLHVFSGSLPPGPYVRLDLHPDRGADRTGSVYDVWRIFGHTRFRLLVADPPYSAADAAHYATPMVNRRRAIAALRTVVTAGAHLAWLDTTWPMHSKREWVTVGRILVQRSTNHRVRLLSLFEAV